MKLLFDQNLSPRLVDLLSDAYPQSQHVQSAGLGCAVDDAAWGYARQYGFMTVERHGFSRAQRRRGDSTEGRVDSPRQLLHGED